MNLKITGYLVSIFCLISFVLLLYFEESININYTLKLFITISLVLAGLFFYKFGKAFDNLKKELPHYNKVKSHVINGDKIILTLDKCEIKENNYYEDISYEHKTNSDVEALDELYDSSRNMKKKVY